MVHEMIDGTYRQTNLPNESPEYLAKRDELRLAEIELLKQRERVAALRRSLPKGATIQDYEFLEGPAALDAGDEPVNKVRLSELFTARIVRWSSIISCSERSRPLLVRCALPGSTATMA